MPREEVVERGDESVNNEGSPAVNSEVDSSDEDEDDDDEEAMKEIREGFIVDDEEDEVPGGESTRRHKKKKKKRSRTQISDDEADALDEDDLDLLLENSGQAPRQKAPSSNLKRLKRAEVEEDELEDEESDPNRRGLTDMFSDVEDEDEDDIHRTARVNDEFDDFIEEDEFSEDENRPRERQIMALPPIEMTENEKETLAELDDIFGDGRDYEWALEEEEEGAELQDETHAKATELTDVFEHSELKERMLTAEDNDIRTTDIPERFQVLRKGIQKYKLDDDEFEEEVEWVALQMTRFRTKLLNSSIEFPAEFKKSIRIVLEFISKENYEVPFIWSHRRDYLLHTYTDYDNVLKVQKLLYEDDLWRIVQLDIDFHHMNDSKIALKASFEALGKFDGLYNEEIEEVNSMVELQDITDYLNFNYSKELAATDNSSKKKHSKYAIYEKIRNDPVFEVVKQIGIKASEFAENFTSKSRAFNTVDPSTEPEKEVEQYLSDQALYNSAELALEGVKYFYAEEIFTNPKFRKEIRLNYERYSKVDVLLTEKGKVKVDEKGPYGDFKYLINHPTSTFVERPDLFLRMLEAESLGYIVIKVNFDLKSFGTHIFEKYLQSDYSSAIAESWNNFRHDALNIALKKITPLVSLNVIEDIRRDCENKIFFDIRKRFTKKLDQAPYKPAGYAKGTIPRVLAISSGQGNRQDAVIASCMNPEGEVESSVKFDEDVKSNEFVAAFSRHVMQTKPDVIAISGYNVNAKLVLFDVIDGIIKKSNLTVNTASDLEFDTDNNEPPLLELLWVNNETPRLFENSARAKVEFPDRSQVARFTIAMARYVQQPLLEYIALKEELTSISIHKHQYLLSTEKLTDALETAIVDIVNQVGVDINEAIRDEYLALLLPFVSGLGPRKASGMILNIQSRGSTLVARSDLVTEGIATKFVFVNCASFLKIPYNSSADADPLDATRIHPQDYDLAIKMAADTLELDEEDIDSEERGTVINQLTNEGVEKLNDLVLEDYGNELEERFKVKKRSTLQMIKEELQQNYEELRRSFHRLTVFEIFHMLTGESRDTFHENTILPVTLRVVRDRFMIGSTQFNVECKIDGEFMRDYNNPVTYTSGQTVQACILRVDYDNFKCEGSVLKRDITRFLNESNVEKIEGLWDFTAEANDAAIEKAKEHAEKRSSRRLLHPLFHNFNSRQAEDYLAPRLTGECVIRPSSLGENNYAITLKIADQLFQHIVLVQHTSQDNRSFFTIDKEKFEDLDEVINRYVEGLTEKVLLMTTHDKFRKAPLDDVRDWLQKYSLAQGRSSYTFCFNRRAPGWFYLLFKINPQAPISTWHVRALPEGYELAGEKYPDMTSLCNGFKQIMMNRASKGRSNGRPTAPSSGGYSIYGGNYGRA